MGQPKEKDMIKIHRWSSVILALALLAAVAFLIPGVLRASETDEDNEFAAKVAGTYLVARDPADGPSRILTIYADGNLSSIQSIQFSEGAGPEGNAGFSDQQGAWKKGGNQQIQATVLDLEYDLSDGTFLGTARAHYVLEFDEDFQTVEGTVEGEVFEPGVDPLHPGEAAPIAQFTDEFTAQRISPYTKLM
jgi:hypothetical protein